MAKKNHKKGQCVYCGRLAELGHDHIPPANLFARPRPQNLVSVPSCLKCNLGFSKDDEYFRWALALREDTSDHPDVKGILPEIMRGLRRTESVGLRAAAMGSLRKLQVKTPGGILLGFRPGYIVESTRMIRTSERITRGLFYHENKLRLRDDYGVYAFEDGMTRNWPKDLQEEVSTFVIQALAARGLRTIGNKVFSYKFLCLPEDVHASVWMMAFYDKVFFLSLTGPNDD